MPNQALAEIVAVEKEIQTRLAGERRKAAAWQAEERERISREVEDKLSAARGEFRQAVARAEAEAETAVSSMIREAEEYAGLLQNLPDEQLLEIIARHLPDLLPETEK